MAVDALAHEPGGMDVRYSVRSPVGRLRPCARAQGAVRITQTGDTDVAGRSPATAHR
jgi:hypothetical protein